MTHDQFIEHLNREYGPHVKRSYLSALRQYDFTPAYALKLTNPPCCIHGKCVTIIRGYWVFEDQRDAVLAKLKE